MSPFDNSDHANGNNNLATHRYNGAGVGEITYLADNMALNEHNHTTPGQQSPAGGSDDQHARTSPPSPSPTSYNRNARVSSFGNGTNENCHATLNGNKAPHPLSMETRYDSPPNVNGRWEGRWEAANQANKLANSGVQGAKVEMHNSPQLSSPFVTPFNSGPVQQKQVQGNTQGPAHAVPGPNQQAQHPYHGPGPAQQIDYPATVITERQLQNAEYYALDRGNGVSVRLVPIDELPEVVRLAITQGVILHNCIVLPKPPMLASLPIQSLQNIQMVPAVQMTPGVVGMNPGAVAMTPATPYYTPASTMPMSVGGSSVLAPRQFDAMIDTQVANAHYRQHSSSISSYTASTQNTGQTTPQRRAPLASLQGSPLVVGRNYSAPTGNGRREKIYCDKWVHDGVCAFAQQGCKYKHEMPMDVPTQRSLGLFHGLPAWWKREHGIELKRDDVGVRSHSKTLEDAERTRELLMPKKSISPVPSVTMSSWRLPHGKENANTPLAPGSGKGFGQGGGGGVFGEFSSWRTNGSSSVKSAKSASYAKSTSSSKSASSAKSAPSKRFVRLTAQEALDVFSGICYPLSASAFAYFDFAC